MSNRRMRKEAAERAGITEYVSKRARGGRGKGGGSSGAHSTGARSGGAHSTGARSGGAHSTGPSSVGGGSSYGGAGSARSARGSTRGGGGSRDSLRDQRSPRQDVSRGGERPARGGGRDITAGPMAMGLGAGRGSGRGGGNASERPLLSAPMEAAEAGGDGVPNSRLSPSKPQRAPLGMSLDEAAPPVHLVSDAAFAPLPPGAPARHAWPLFGSEELPQLSPEVVSLAGRLFRRGSRYLGDASDFLTPEAKEPEWTEIPVLGRSNVGKSTLLNALLGSVTGGAGGLNVGGHGSFVRVSRQPGSTRHMDWFALGPSAAPRAVLIDTPGYGYSSRGKGAGDAWLESIATYLESRATTVLGRPLLLLDARNGGLTEMDMQVAQLMERCMVPWHAVLTKADALPGGALEAAARNIATQLSRLQLPFPVLSAVSARTGAGLKELTEMVVFSSKLHRAERGWALKAAEAKAEGGRR